MAGQPLRVLHVIGGLELGGAETLLYRLATHSSSSVSHEVICLGERDWYSSRLEQHGIAVHHLGISSVASVPRGIGAFRTLVHTSNANVIQSWMYFANVLSGLIGRRAGVPVTWGIHASSVERSGLGTQLCAYAGGLGSRWLANFVANCSQHSASLHERLGYSAVPNAVIPNGYDPSAFYPDDDKRIATRASLGLDRGAFVIGSISRWHADKDIPSLLRAMSLIRDRGIAATCLFVGRGLNESNAELTREIKCAGLRDRVILLGLREDVPEILQSLDLHILSSLSEAFPNVVAESMLSGVPNVATNVGDSAEMIGETGWIVNPGDFNAIAEAVRQAQDEWRERPEQWKQRRAAARARIAERYSLDRMVKAYEQVWREVAFRR